MGYPVKEIIEKALKLHRAGNNLLVFALKTAFFRSLGLNIYAHHMASITGLKNIVTHGCLKVGIHDIGFMHRKDRTLLNIKGRLIVRSDFSVERGCRVEIGNRAICDVGGGYVNANSKFIIMHGLKIGHDCAISWGCEFLDEDFHILSYRGKTGKNNEIVIGDHVLIGSNSRIMKGVLIGNNNMIAANSVLTKSFPEENVLIGGHPAEIIKRDVSWRHSNQSPG